MSEDGDPADVTAALAAAIDAFNEEGHGVPTPEPRIETESDWRTQLTKACRLLGAIDELAGTAYYTAAIELCFGTIERSLEAYAIAEAGDELRDFHDHTYAFERASALGLFSRGTTRDLEAIYGTNRTESYYGGRQPTAEQAVAMEDLARSIHLFVAEQIREGGVCVCEG